MYLPQRTPTFPSPDENDVYAFRLEDGCWYIDLPDYGQQGWQKQDLRMAEGAHKFLNWMSNGASKVRLCLRTEPAERSSLLELVQHCEAPRGGAIYLFVPASGGESSLFWICDLALFVFGDMPERIYVKRLPVKAQGNRAGHQTPSRQGRSTA